MNNLNFSSTLNEITNTQSFHQYLAELAQSLSSSGHLILLKPPILFTRQLPNFLPGDYYHETFLNWNLR
jgi:hypothetical protein